MKKISYCNKCSKELTQKEDYLSIEKKWGYFSGMDQNIYRFQICEACFRTIIGEFQVPPAISEDTELL